MTMQGVYTATVQFTGGTTSAIVPTGGGALVGVFTPAMVGTSLQVEGANGDQSSTPGTFVGVFDFTGTRISTAISATAGYRLFDQSKLAFGVDYVRFVSSANETATITAVFQRVV